MMHLRRFRLLTALAAALALAGPARALESDSARTPRDTATLISEEDTFAPGAPVRLALRLRLLPGWHTYWSNPGDAGAPPTLDVSGASAGPIAFPAPELLRDGPFTSYAYTGEVVLPVTVTPKPGTEALSLDATATWLVCATICVPEDAKFHIDIPRGTGAPGAQAPLFAMADRRIPRPSPFPAHVAADGTLWLEAAGLPVTKAVFFPAEPGVVDQGAQQGLRVGANIIAVGLKPLKPPLHALSGVLGLTDQGGQTEFLTITATPKALPADALPPAAELGLVQTLLLALLGGLILNLMPCVLPVLAMKALALARLSGSARTQVRKEAGFYTLGVVSAFAAIGAVTLAARELGHAAGWGTQFQSAAFTTGMAWLLFGIGLNMSGVFEIGARLTGSGQGLAARGSFFTGLLAVVVATPCTAPFMGAALAGAMAMPPATSILVFLALGLGLSAPYAALALVPGIARLLPRPGGWMDLLKHLLAFPMYAASLWLVWVASQQVDAMGLAYVFAGLLLIGFACWAFGYAQAHERARVLNGAALFAVAVSVAGLFTLGGVAASVSKARAADGSEPFSPSRLAQLRSEHRPVLVDMSAAWCVTCLVNERVALTPQPVREAFVRHNVAFLKGDWTRRDSAITEFLRDHDRSGVPLYVFYPPNGAAEVLPQILTPGLILDRINQG